MEEADDMFSFEEDELSSVCSSLTHASSASPSRDLSTCRYSWAGTVQGIIAI